MKEETFTPMVMAPLSSESIKLATAIYNTYIAENDPYLSIPLESLCRLFNLENSHDTYAHLQELFAELNEPVLIENFVFRGQHYKWEPVSFCSFDEDWKEGDEFLEITINELFLAVMKERMSEPFIPLR